MKHINITVKGKVQGVFFRAFTQKEAQRLYVNGFVRNEPNGDVYIEAEAEEAILKEFIDWCRMGPPKSVVKEIEIKESELKTFVDFKINK